MLFSRRKIPLMATALLCAAALASCAGPNELYMPGDGQTPAAGSVETVTADFIDEGPLPEQLGVDEFTEEEYVAQYEPIVKSDTHVLYADMQKGWFALKDIHAGQIWYSRPNDFLLDNATKAARRMEVRSDVLLGYVFASEEASTKNLLTASSHAECVRNKTVTVTRLDTGIRVEYDFAGYNTWIPVEYTLCDGYFQARLVVDGILSGEEYRRFKTERGEPEPDPANDCLVASVTLLPAFGAGSALDEGYILIPDGCGAVIEFDDATDSRNYYESMVYGEEPTLEAASRDSNTQAVRLPVFGTVKNGGALMGIIEKGDGAASIQAMNSYANNYYTGVCSKANLQMAARTTLYENDAINVTEIMKVTRIPELPDEYVVRYYTLNGESATYAGMAARYRQYLMEEKGMRATADQPAVALNLYGAAQIASSFLGIPYNKLQPLTTFEQAASIVSDLEARGLTNLAVRYIGWNHTGIDNETPLQDASPLGILGGTEGMQSLNTLLDGEGRALYLDNDLLRYRTGGNGVSKNGDSARSAFGEAALQYEYLLSVFATDPGVTPSRLLTPYKVNWQSARYRQSFDKLGLKHVGLGTMGSVLYASLDDETGFHRAFSPDAWTTALEEWTQAGYRLAVEGGNAYALPYAERVYNAPVYSSGQDIFSYDVPFYQMALHGLVYMTGPSQIGGVQPDVTLLKAAETGSELLFDGMYADASMLMDTPYNDLYSTTYSMWADLAEEQYRQYADLLEATADQFITGHDRLAAGVYRTVYENGTSVVVNYTDEAFTDPQTGLRADALSFAWGGGAA